MEVSIIKKFLIALAAVLTLTASLLVGCDGGGGAPASLENTTWEVTEASQDGMDVIALMKSMGSDATMTVEFKDGKMIMSAMGETQELGSYTYENGKLKTDGDDGADVKVTSNTITMEVDGMKLVMKKK